MEYEKKEQYEHREHKQRTERHETLEYSDLDHPAIHEAKKIPFCLLGSNLSLGKCDEKISSQTSKKKPRKNIGKPI